MTKATPVIQLFAYYLSKYDMEAVKALGYTTRSAAMRGISIAFYEDNNYLKLRRDEFDVVTGSHRNGWRNRKPLESVVNLARYYDSFSFDEITRMVQSLLEGASLHSDVERRNSIRKAVSEFSEEEIEHLINYHDEKAQQKIESVEIRTRILNRNIIDSLKQLYHYRCQICGHSTDETYGVSVVEAHHIDPFASSTNNDASNLIILCPNHHRIIHASKAVFVRDNEEWQYPNGCVEHLTLNHHL